MRKILTVGCFDNVIEAKAALDEGLNALTPEEREKADYSYQFDPETYMFKVIISVEN